MICDQCKIKLNTNNDVYYEETFCDELGMDICNIFCRKCHEMHKRLAENIIIGFLGCFLFGSTIYYYLNVSI